MSDGQGASYYTGGSRTATGEARYFEMIYAAFASLRKLLTPGAVVIQVVGFGDLRAQLPRYREAMLLAGYREDFDGGERLSRRVPNRKWYAKLQDENAAADELMLIHRPA